MNVSSEAAASKDLKEHLLFWKMEAQERKVEFYEIIDNPQDNAVFPHGYKWGWEGVVKWNFYSVALEAHSIPGILNHC